MSRTYTIVTASAAILLVFVLEQVRRRRLREEYSWLWLLTAIGFLMVAIWPRLAVWIVDIIGSANPVAVFAFLGILFLLLISIQYSIQISRLATQSKDLAQQIAIVDHDLARLLEGCGRESGTEQAMLVLQLADRCENLAQQVTTFRGELERFSERWRSERNEQDLLGEHIGAECPDH